MCPAYAYPPDLLLGLVTAGLLGRQRDFRLDARRCISTLQPPLQVFEAQLIPENGPLLVVSNHYSRPGLPVWWPSMAISSMLPMPHRWISAAEWTDSGSWFNALKSHLSPFLLGRLAAVYDFLPMPPMPARQRDVEARAEAVRLALSYTENTPDAVICLSPEGRDIPGGALGWPPSGAGRFISLLAGRGLSILPAGAWEEGDRLTLRFGPAYQLSPGPAPDPSLSHDARAAARDHSAACTIMKSIASLLPPAMRGEFA
jgi:1-acyl-sn-glycerol-3-phosphate acyltransferase